MDRGGLLSGSPRNLDYHAPLGAWFCDLVCCGQQLSMFTNGYSTTESAGKLDTARESTAIEQQRALDERLWTEEADATTRSTIVYGSEIQSAPNDIVERPHHLDCSSAALVSELQQPLQEDSDGSAAFTGEPAMSVAQYHEDPALLQWRVSAMERLAHADKELLPGTRLRFGGAEGTYRSRSKSRFGKNSHSIQFDESGVRSVHLAGHKDDKKLVVLCAPSIHHDGSIKQKRPHADGVQRHGGGRSSQTRSARHLQSFVHLFGRETARNNPKTNLEESVPTWVDRSHTHEIELYKSQIDNRRCSQLASLLPLCPTLVKLGLAYNHIGDKGALMLAIALPRLTALEEINLGLNAIEDEGAIGLARASPHCHSLRVLSLRSNGIGNAGAAAIAETLPQCGALRELNLARNSFGTAGLEVLVSARPNQLSLRLE